LLPCYKKGKGKGCHLAIRMKMVKISAREIFCCHATRMKMANIPQQEEAVATLLQEKERWQRSHSKCSEIF